MNTSLHSLRILIAPLCLAIFAIFATLPVPLSALVLDLLAVEAECPWEEREDTSEEEVVAGPSVRRRVPKVRKTRSRESVGVVEFLKIFPTARRLPAIVGHQLANGLRAPLVI